MLRRSDHDCFKNGACICVVTPHLLLTIANVRPHPTPLYSSASGAPNSSVTTPLPPCLPTHSTSTRTDRSFSATKMPYTILILAYRKPGTTPSQFKAYYEGRHVPLVRSLTGATFPLSHTRRYLQRSDGVQAESDSTRSPATVLVGTQADFDYDAVTELTFEDEAAFRRFMGVTQKPEIAAQIAADEEHFLDRTRVPIVVLGDIAVTRR
ncbi:EthD domain-containing protein [Astrocystis sublimbata]|nr:EthD domain-containing protein [Astrocystis sublimbata]